MLDHVMGEFDLFHFSHSGDSHRPGKKRRRSTVGDSEVGGLKFRRGEEPGDGSRDEKQ